jgi:hypothetical protein
VRPTRAGRHTLRARGRRSGANRGPRVTRGSPDDPDDAEPPGWRRLDDVGRAHPALLARREALRPDAELWAAVRAWADAAAEVERLRYSHAYRRAAA